MRRAALIFAILILAPLPIVAQSDTPSDRSAFAELDKSIEAASPSQRIAYNALLIAFIAFRDAHLRYETCLSAANCPQFQAAERLRLNHDFLLMAHGFSPTPPPVFTPADLTTADESLNGYFEKVTALLPASCPGPDCLSKSTFQEIQRDWIRYRDAWVTFGLQRFPAISQETWRTYLTQQRNAQLLGHLPSTRYF